jgi:hypothetical protein
LEPVCSGLSLATHPSGMLNHARRDTTYKNLFILVHSYKQFLSNPCVKFPFPFLQWQLSL